MDRKRGRAHKPRHRRLSQTGSGWSERGARAEAAIKGELTPKVQSLEIDVKPPASAPIVTPIPLTGPSSNALERGFTVTLPLNVSLKVESLIEPPAPAVAKVASAPLPAPAIVSGGEDEFLFEKLKFDTDYSDRDGYDENFLGRERQASMPTIDRESIGQIAPTKKRGKILHYHHFSSMVHATRKMPVLAAWNTDYSKGQRKIKGRETFGKDEWIIDIRMDEEYQLFHAASTTVQRTGLRTSRPAG